MSRFYTGRGDKGYSNMLGKKIKKNNNIIDAIGNVDELNSFMGLVIANIDDKKIENILRNVQEKLFIIGAELASCINKRFKPKKALTYKDITELEKEINKLASSLPDFKSFVLPGGSLDASYLHVARAIARRTERGVVRIEPRFKKNKQTIPYLNRLSSLLFVAALYLNKKKGIKEISPRY